MSTEHQQYSLANQADAIREYAKVNGFEIIRTYDDAGKATSYDLQDSRPVFTKPSLIL
jgi:DNA invertase Pin-like site-specific DNA recombinase